MLLNNNDNAQPSGVVFRRQKQDSQQQQHNNNNNNSKKKGGKSGAGGGTSSVRNSWSFTTELPIQHHVPMAMPIKENIYVDPETLMNGNDVKAVSRSRLRQRSVSNLNAAALAGTRSRDHSSSNRHHQNGTMSAKGVDYIRIHPSRPPMTVAPLDTMAQTTILPPPVDLQDRSEYGNPDGSSAHSTAERAESGILNGSGKSLDSMDLYQAINQNQSNDYKIIQGYVMPETGDANSNKNSSGIGSGVSISSNCSINSGRESAAHHQLQQQQQPLVRHGSGRGSAARGGFPSSSSSSSGSTDKTTQEVQASSRKPASAAGVLPTSTGPNAVKTEWTFLPSPTAATEPQHREINSKPEVCYILDLI